MSHNSSHGSNPLVVLSSLAMFVFATLFGVAIMTGTKVHLEGSAATKVTLGILCIIIGAVVALGAIVADRNS